MIIPVSGLEAAAQISLSLTKMWLKENKEAVDASCLLVKEQGVWKVESYCKDYFIMQIVAETCLRVLM